MISSLKGLLSLGGLTPKELAARVWRGAMSYDDLFSYLARVAPRSAYALIYETVNEVAEGGGRGKLTFYLTGAAIHVGGAQAA